MVNKIKKKSNKTYSSKQIEAVIKMKEAFPNTSIRDLAKMSGTSKSVVGRWIKNSDVSIQKAEKREVGKTIKGKNKKGESKKAIFNRMMNKIIKESKGSQYKLRVKNNQTGGWDVIS